jgi:hypothetical protein
VAQHTETPGTVIILVGAVLLALCVALVFYLVLDSPGSSSAPGTIGISFLLLLPAALSALSSYLSDRSGTRRLAHHLLVPLVLMAVILFAGFVFLQEGVVCVALLIPLWLPAAFAGSLLTYGIRRRLRERGRLFCAALLVFPMVATQVEMAFPPQPRTYKVHREILVDAPPERIWPLLVSIPAIAPSEGRWNVSQDLLGIPRPVSARLEWREGRLVRSARWESEVRFEELITDWRPNESIGWRFVFPDDSVREHTDRHISPNGYHLNIERGAYRLQRAPGGRTRVVLETEYVLRTPLRHYAAWWGETLLGDIQDNVLAIIKGRAEAS